MRKLIQKAITSLFIVGVAALQVATAQSGSVYQDPARQPLGSNYTVLGFFTSSPPVIDGELDDDCWTIPQGAVGAASGGAGYSSATTSFPAQPVKMQINGDDPGTDSPRTPPVNPVSGYPASAGSFGMSWDKDYLYFAIYGVDPKIAAATTVVNPGYLAELFLNNGNGTTGSTAVLASIYPSELAKSGRDIQFNMNRIPATMVAEYPLLGSGIAIPQGIQIQNLSISNPYKVAVKKTSNGYIYEGRIAWKVINNEFYKESDGSWDAGKGVEKDWAPNAAGFTGAGRKPMRVDLSLNVYDPAPESKRKIMMWNQCCYNINWSRTQFYGYMSLQGVVEDVKCPTSFAVTLTPSSITTINGTSKATAVVPVGTTKEFAWSVIGTTPSGFPLAIIDNNTGIISPINNGTATIMVKSDNNTCKNTVTSSGINGTASLSISNQVAPTGFNIAGTDITTNWGTSTLSTTPIPSNAPNYVTWSINATNLAVINSITGVLESTSLGNGTVTVTATSVANGVTSSKVINISTPTIITTCFGINAYSKINQCGRTFNIATVGGLNIGDEIPIFLEYYDPNLTVAGVIPSRLTTFSKTGVGGSDNFTITKSTDNWILKFGQITGRVTITGTYFNKATSDTRTTNLILFCKGANTFSGCSGQVDANNKSVEFSVYGLCGGTVTGINDNIIEASTFSLAPNPANDQVKVSVDLQQGGVLGISIVNTMGVEVASSTSTAVAGKNVVDLSTASLSPGLYIVKVSLSGGGSIAKKLLIAK